jgi:hypothetical protein
LKSFKASILATLFGAVALVSTSASEEFSDYVGFLPSGPAITQADVEAAQAGWGKAVVAIGEAGKDAPKVEYTKGYVKTPDERVLIFLQDSSMPYGS